MRVLGLSSILRALLSLVRLLGSKTIVVVRLPCAIAICLRLCLMWLMILSNSLCILCSDRTSTAITAVFPLGLYKGGVLARAWWTAVWPGRAAGPSAEGTCSASNLEGRMLGTATLIDDAVASITVFVSTGSSE